MYGPELDYIGVESCADLQSEVDPPPHRGGGNRRRRLWEAPDKGHPPPIPSLARTVNLPPRMPWVMKRYYTSDGRLIIKEEKVKHHDYFQAHRSNGRLVLNLVHLDYVVEENCHAGEENINHVNQFSGEEIYGGDEGVGDPSVEDAVPERYKYNGIGLTPCSGFVVAVAAAAALGPPVHT